MMIVVAIFALSLAREFTVVRARQEWLRLNAALTVSGTSNPEPAPRAIMPWRVWMGDRPQPALYFPTDMSEAKRRRAQRLFPEAHWQQR